MSFQKSVLIIALIVFSIMLFFIALAMKGLKKSQKFPPEISECPDYWIRDNNKCVPLKYNKSESSLQKCQEYTGSQDKLDWKRDCNVEWDGIEE